MVRLTHFSDVHLYCPAKWRVRDWFTKRISRLLNLRYLPGSRRFCDASKTFTAFVADVYNPRPDWLIFSGDASSLGFCEEYQRVADALRVGQPDSIPGIAVPGNHDYYTAACAASGDFEHVFAPWQEGERVGDHTYPFARKVGHVYLIAVNSCTGN